MKCLFLFIFSMPFFFHANCEKLDDGSYLVKYFGESAAEGYKVEIIGNDFKNHLNNGISQRGKITWLSDCGFILKMEEKNKPDSLNRIQQILKNSFGEPFIEIKESKGDTIKFRTTYTGNLHVTINEGYFLKIK